MLIAKRGKPFTEGEFIKDCVMKMVDNICPEKKQEFASVCLVCNTVARRIEEISSDIKRQVGDRGVNFVGVDDDMKITEELLDLQSLKGQTRGVDLFDSVCCWTVLILPLFSL